MESLELFFRFAAIALFAAQIALVIRDARGEPAARFYALMLAGIIGFLATHASVDLALPGLLHLPLSLLSKTAALFIWWFVFALFVDGFRLGRVEIAVAVFWAALVPFDFEPVIRLAPDIAGFATASRIALSIGLAVYILGRLLADRGVDLVEPRRSARVWLAAVIVLLFVADLAGDAMTGYGVPPLMFSAIQKAAILAFAFASMMMILQARRAVFQFERQRPSKPPRSIDGALYERLQSALAEGVHLDPDLSLPGLAERLGAPEHRLRMMINAGLGHRNFRSFVNEHRVEAAKKALTAPERSTESVTSIALSSGFASLASFNRVFKDMTGDTPSGWRNKNASI